MAVKTVEILCDKINPHSAKNQVIVIFFRIKQIIQPQKDHRKKHKSHTFAHRVSDIDIRKKIR